MKIEHTESFKKELEFEPWADRMNVSAENKAKLRTLLFKDMIASAREFLMPRTDGDKVYFRLTETIIIARKDLPGFKLLEGLFSFRNHCPATECAS